MAISYRTRKFIVSLRANTTVDIRSFSVDRLPNAGELLTVLTQKSDRSNYSATFKFTADDTATGVRDADTTYHIGLEDSDGNALSISDLVQRILDVLSIYRGGLEDASLLLSRLSDNEIRIEQKFPGAVITLATQAWGTRTNIQVGSDGIANPAINVGAATIEADSSNLGFNPALESSKIQINCNDYQGGGAGTFDVLLRPAGSERYVEASTGNVAGTDAAVIGGTNLDLLSDGIKLNLDGVTAADAEIYITFIKE